MAVGKTVFPEMHPINGVQLGVVKAGIKYPNHDDLVVLAGCEGTTVAGVFTKNAFCAAPVLIAKQHLGNLDPEQKVYLVINTGNANTGTGQQGFDDAHLTCTSLASVCGVNEGQILPFSTGVIGEKLPVDKIVAGLPQIIEGLSDNNWQRAASGIMTTDTRPKGSSSQINLSVGDVHISGISKGAGMIKPNMATMLGFVATDLAVDQSLLQELVTNASNKSFNRISVDGDTSTNDSLVMMATGKSGFVFKQLSQSDQQLFIKGLESLFIDLATQIVKDGEGATKFVSVKVDGGANQQECLDVAYTVAESPLVKTALFASDPNWGRILAAVGRAGLKNLAVEEISIWLNEVQIVEKGGRAASYTEQSGQKVMDCEEIVITIGLARGECSETVWTCDLSHDYVRINAEYRT